MFARICSVVTPSHLKSLLQPNHRRFGIWPINSTQHESCPIPKIVEESPNTQQASKTEEVVQKHFEDKKTEQKPNQKSQTEILLKAEILNDIFE